MQPTRRSHRVARALPLAGLLCLAMVAVALWRPAGVAGQQPRPVAGGQNGAQDGLPGLPIGAEKVIGRCIHVSVLNLTDRDSNLANNDWVTLRIENACPSARRHLLVDLVLIDPTGVPYGARMFILQRGQILQPGDVLRERFAVPDHGNLMPVRWDLRLVDVQAPRQRPEKRRRMPAPGPQN